MSMLLATFLSPLWTLAVAAVAVVAAKIYSLPKPRLGMLVWLTLIFAAAGSITSLLLTIGWMVWYERTTGYSAGNAPVFWIFFYGPAGAALGQLLALVVWWFKKPGANSTAAA